MVQMNLKKSGDFAHPLRIFSVALSLTALLAAPLCMSSTAAIAAPQLILGSGNVDSDKPRRPFMLRNSFGEAFGDQSLLGKFTILYFGYTSCPDVCPTSLMTMTEVLDGLGEEAKAMTPLFISVDPDRDSLADLRDYTSAFHEQIMGLTGPKVMVDAAVDAFNARYEFTPSDDGDPMGYAVDHTASMTFVGPNGRIITRFGYGKSTDEIVTRIKQELKNYPKLVYKLKQQAKR